MVLLSLGDLNWAHIVVATIAGMVLGWLWYSPVLFAKQWMQAIKVTPKDIASAGKTPAPYVKAMLGHLLTAITVAELVYALDAHTLGQGIWTGLLVGVGLFAALQAVHLGFKGNKVLAFINTSYDIVVVVMMGGLLAMWR